MLWAGTDDGLVHLSRDRGATWQTGDAAGPAGVGADQRHRALAARRGAPATSRPRATSTTTRAPTSSRRATTGSTWTRISGGICRTASSRASIREDPGRRGLLYCGTETGVWVSFDDGGALAAAARQPAGRAGPRPHRQGRRPRRRPRTGARSGSSTTSRRCTSSADAVATADAHLFTPRRTVRWRAYRGHGMKPGPEPRDRLRMAGSLGLRLSPGRVADRARRRSAARRGREPAERRDRALLAARGAGGRRGARVPRRRRAGDPLVHEPQAGRRAPRTRPGAAATGGGGEEPPPAPDAPGRAKDEEPHPTKDAGANRFVWNLRGPDATKLPDNKGRGGAWTCSRGPACRPAATRCGSP